MQGQPPLISYIISFAVIAIVMAIRWRRMSREQPLKLERLWIMPAVLLALTAWLFWTQPPHGWAWGFCAGAMALGAMLGWQRGRMMHIAVDPDTHALNQRASPGAILFLVALVVVRQGARMAAGSATLHIDPVAVTDVLLAFALGLFSVTRLEMYLRGKRLLADARAQGSTTA